MSAVAVVVFLCCLACEAVGAGIVLVYWRLWGRARFDRRLEREVDDEIARRAERQR